MVRREAATQAEVEVSSIGGEAVAARLRWRGCAVLMVVGVHNFGTTAAEQRHVAETIRQAHARAAAAPNSEIVTVAAGVEDGAESACSGDVGASEPIEVGVWIAGAGRVGV